MAIIDTLLINYPVFIPIILLTLGALYFNYVIIRNYAHFHWNLFMIALGLLAVGFLLWLLGAFYPHESVSIIVHAVIALSAMLFAFTAYVANVSDKKWR